MQRYFGGPLCGERGKRLLTEEAVIRKAGMKAVLSLESNERISTENGYENLEENKNFILKMRETGNSDIRGTICTHTTFSCSTPFLMKAAGMAVTWMNTSRST